MKTPEGATKMLGYARVIGMRNFARRCLLGRRLTTTVMPNSCSVFGCNS